jgi:hypothetical protein
MDEVWLLQLLSVQLGLSWIRIWDGRVLLLHLLLLLLLLCLFAGPVPATTRTATAALLLLGWEQHAC